MIRVFSSPWRSTRAGRFPLGISGLAWLLLSSCSGKAGGPAFQFPPVAIEVAPVEIRTVRDHFHALGSLEAADNIQVVSEIAGTVRELPFIEGSAAEQDALLAQLDDREIRADAERANALLDQARSNAARVGKLAEQNLVSEQQVEDARSALKVAEADASLSATRLDKTRIRAPFAGVVGRRRVSPGAYLKAGDVITELARIDVLKLNFSAPERFSSELKRGAAVAISVTAYPTESFHGELSVVDPILDPDSRTVQLVARIPNPGGRLKPGMSADVSATLATRVGALVVPDEAVFAEGDQSYVYLVKSDHTVTRLPVGLGARDSASVEVTHGLKAGDQVVRAGHQKLFEGAHVMPVTSAPAAAPAASGR